MCCYCHKIVKLDACSNIRRIFNNQRYQQQIDLGRNQPKGPRPPAATVDYAQASSREKFAYQYSHLFVLLLLGQYALDMELAGTYITQVEFDAIREEHQTRKYANYKNGGITLPQTQFVGPGNRVVDKDNKSNFNQLPDNCLDWTALEHDVDYHNAGNTGSTQLHEIAALDNKAIDAAWRECLSSQPLGTSILASGLNVKQHFEHLAETISWPFGKNQAVYPPSTSNTQHIDWFDKKLSRHRGTLEGEEVVVQPDIVSEEEGSETFVVPDETDSDLDWNFDGGINPNTPRDVHSPMSGPTSTTPDSKRGNDSVQGGSGSKKTKLPGTGRQAADDPDTGNPSLENAVIPRPIHKSTGYTMVFRKNHSIISYGLASVQLQFGTFASEL
eukprot:XP_016663338.1 PREDICTED: uncharacterized protein LOC103310565 [Acyrthosiphon pisum]